jgi:large subunit ribosomal protein L19
MINQAILPKIKTGATVRVFESFKEKDAESGKEKERTTRFEGLIIARKHGMEPGASFTVRATIAGVGVEKNFPLYSPSISKVDVISSPKKVSRAKLYYVRDLSKRNIRRKTAVATEAEKA